MNLDRPHKLLGGVLLVAAVSKGSVEMVRLLVDQGANVNGINDDGTTPLLAAIGVGSLEMVGMLLQVGGEMKGGMFRVSGLVYRVLVTWVLGLVLGRWVCFAMCGLRCVVCDGTFLAPFLHPFDLLLPRGSLSLLHCEGQM